VNLVAIARWPCPAKRTRNGTREGGGPGDPLSLIYLDPSNLNERPGWRKYAMIAISFKLHLSRARVLERAKQELDGGRKSSGVRVCISCPGARV